MPVAGPYLFTFNGDTAQSSEFELAEFVAYDVALSTLELEQVEGYLSWKFGLQVCDDNLPVNEITVVMVFNEQAMHL